MSGIDDAIKDAARAGYVLQKIKDLHRDIDQTGDEDLERQRELAGEVSLLEAEVASYGWEIPDEPN